MILIPGTISAVTDKLVPLIADWRSRPLEAIYPIVFLEGMYFKSRENGKVMTKVIYNILGVNQDGYKEILGFYVGESEGSNFWLGVLNDLKQRGVQDILIACGDGLAGFPEAIKGAFPKTEIQLCIIHPIRNSLKYVASKNQKEFMKDLKAVYQAPNKDAAEYNLLKLQEKWGEKYPMVIKSWQTNWEHLTHYFQYSGESSFIRPMPLRAFIVRSENTPKQRALLPANLRFLSSFIALFRKLLRNGQRLCKLGFDYLSARCIF